MRVIFITVFLLFAQNAYLTRPERALQKTHEKPQWQKWSEVFLGIKTFDHVQSLVELLTEVSNNYLSECTPIILYDLYTEQFDNLLLQKLLNNYPLAYIHGQITDNYTIKVGNVLKDVKTCVSYIIFIKDVMRLRDVIGDQNYSRVVIIARSSQWRVFEFLNNQISQSFINLLIIAKSEKIVSSQDEVPYILYTHNLYTDALGSNQAHILTSWVRGNLTRSQVSLFPRKLTEGLAGHRFIIYYGVKPPFIINRGRDENGDLIIDGIEIRLVNLLSKMYNFTTDYREAPHTSSIGSEQAVSLMIKAWKGNLGLAGTYYIEERNEIMGQWHSQDCAAFISLASTALPRYRAIMGPFHWSVWIVITFIYMFAILPLAFSDKHTLRPLLKNPEEIENMFWYVFGYFTNCFTFIGQKSWCNTKKITTRLLIGFYWIFTIIITACYTGSIIAFVTLPVLPTVVDSVEQLLSGHYQIGTLDRDGWEYRYDNSSDPITLKLLKDVDFVPSVEAGIKNTTKAFFWPYAFLGSKAQLDYIIKTNFTATNKRQLFHISKDCFVPYNVGFMFPQNAIYKEILSLGLHRLIEFGFLKKIKSDVEWETMRTATGQRLSANVANGGLRALTVEDRALTLDDTQGMFLLLSFGFALGGASLLSEWLGGCWNACKRKFRRHSTVSTLSSHPRSHEGQTPRQKIDSVDYSFIQKGMRHPEENHCSETVIVENHSRKQEIETDDSKKNNLEEPEDVEINNEFEDSAILEITRLFEDVFGEENLEDEEKIIEVVQSEEDSSE